MLIAFFIAIPPLFSYNKIYPNTCITSKIYATSSPFIQNKKEQKDQSPRLLKFGVTKGILTTIAGVKAR
jgi:hypothetical protein